MLDAHNVEIVNALYVAAVATAYGAAGLAVLAVVFVVVMVPLGLVAGILSRLHAWLYPPPNYAEIARRKLAGARRRAFLQRRADRAAKRARQNARIRAAIA
jgi:hypothetical protein